jgi:hypothetical protein
VPARISKREVLHRYGERHQLSHLGVVF